MGTICGADCSQCWMKEKCGGCAETGGRPFGGDCVLASCCRDKGQKSCAECTSCEYRARLMEEYNSLGIADMPRVEQLHALNGGFVNLEYTLPSGQHIKFWKDANIYLGNQLEKLYGDRCYGLTADDEYLLVCEYGENGSDPKIVCFQRRPQYPQHKPKE